jgi:hypothetical protein
VLPRQALTDMVVADPIQRFQFLFGRPALQSFEIAPVRRYRVRRAAPLDAEVAEEGGQLFEIGGSGHCGSGPGVTPAGAGRDD